ncbi:PilN domain-containing protein [Marinobacter sp. F4206]|uniref:PilN domain-containing protein n=1 Tax=Marinobacter sp. F4206 TaxID=2861777 RepID=UPI001C5F6DB2|nr:PilN domain-containing protein [Marinobacter sp. F4206]MBW4936507.1 PilN domain-containing protein [Marinobacter sp. F4206]
MNQQVNLYVQELRPRKEKLQAGMLLGLVAVLVMGLIVTGTVVHYQNNRLENQVHVLELQNMSVEQDIVRLSEAVSARQPAPEVREALERVTDTLMRRQRLLERVESLVLDDGGRFSPQMAALARQIPEDVWLTGIRLNGLQAKVTIEGRARSSALVPAYLENLGEEPAFSGKTFGAFRLSRPETGRWIEFHVATERSGEVN